jgi:hypothetical protein
MRRGLLASVSAFVSTCIALAFIFGVKRGRKAPAERVDGIRWPDTRSGCAALVGSRV